jgi:LCP family protein required for cell wall assembly
MRKVVLILTTLIVTLSLLVFSINMYISLQVKSLEKVSIVTESKDNQSMVNVEENNSTIYENLENEVNILLFSTGSKGLDPDFYQDLGIGKSRAKMKDGLTDSIVLVNYNKLNQRVNLISIPRDLYIEKYGNRVNTLYNRSPKIFADEVSNLLGLKVDHMIAVNFQAFVSIYEIFGGLTLDIPYPVRDEKAKLYIEEAGCQNLNGIELLAFARSRNWQVYKNGAWRSDSTSSDWGRIDRQQYILRESLSQIGKLELLFNIDKIFAIMNKNVIIDENLSYGKIISLVTNVLKSSPNIKAYTYPGKGAMIAEMSVILPNFEAAELLKNKLNNYSSLEEISSSEKEKINSNEKENNPTMPWLENSGNGGKLYKNCS